MDNLRDKYIDDDESSPTLVRRVEYGFDTTGVFTHHPENGEDAASVERIGHYRILEIIGKGGMGTIYKVEHDFLNRHFAMKVIKSTHLNDPAIADSFTMETLLMGHLQHPNIVQTTDAGNDEGRRYIIMELLDGQDLAQYIKEHGPLPIDVAIDYLRQAVNGLAATHRGGIVHRDVKPANLFLTVDKTIKLLDLGLAKSATQIHDGPNGHLAGSPGFMSPEQILENRSDTRSDIYSLGCTFYFMLTSHAPFEGPEYPNVQSILFAQAAKEFPVLQDHLSGPNYKAQGLLHKMTAKNPADRFQTMEELLSALDKPVIYMERKKKVARPAVLRRIISVTSALILMVVAAVFSYSSADFYAVDACSAQPYKPTLVSCPTPILETKTCCSEEPCTDLQSCPTDGETESRLICRSHCDLSKRSPIYRECW